MSSESSRPSRSAVPAKDTWDLSALFKSDRAWEAALKMVEGQLAGYPKYRGRLGKAPRVLRECLEFDTGIDRALERLTNYAYLKMAEDMGDSRAVGFVSRSTAVAAKAMQASSYIRPEILALPKKTLQSLLKSRALAAYRFNLEQLIRQKPHVLAEPEERLLAMQVEAAQAAGKIFEQLNNADLTFGTIESEGQTVELTHGSFRAFLESPDRSLRERAFRQYYAVFEAHKNTMAATLAASVQQDVFQAKARRHATCLDNAVFHDNVPTEVYRNLVATVRNRLPAVHRFFDLRRKALGVEALHQFDTYVPILADMKMSHTFGEATELILEALKPLGADYVKVLRKGLNSRWVDRYENQGKRSGAFSSGCFDSPPYILMNFKEDVLDDVFTLAHEAGHSMHSYFSAKHQPYPTWSYTIFVAEVASTCNEQLLGHHLLSRATDPRVRAYLLNREIDAIRGTLVRQTMFAEFELVIHELVEKGEALTLDRLRSEYRTLLEAYFGPAFVIDSELELEGMRIPHFYRAFYVYKYATGISAAIALSERLLKGGKKALEDYLGFLKAGGSRYPLEILASAGVDMRQPEPVSVAMDRFETCVDELAALLDGPVGRASLGAR